MPEGSAASPKRQPAVGPMAARCPGARAGARGSAVPLAVEYEPDASSQRAAAEAAALISLYHHISGITELQGKSITLDDMFYSSLHSS